MDERSIAILKHLSSPSCNRVLQCLEEGLDHPDDIAKTLEVVRQTVDWHLIRLSALGIVDRKAVSSVHGRPKVIYGLSQKGQELIGKIEALTSKHFESLMEELEMRQKELDYRLARGEISEAVYLNNLKKLDDERALINCRSTASR